MYKNIRLPIACFLLLSLVCNNLYAWGDKPNLSKLSGIKGQQVSLFFLGKKEASSENLGKKEAPSENLTTTITTSDSYYVANPALQKAMEDCVDTPKDGVSKAEIPAPLIPIVIGAGKLLFDLYMDAKIRENETLKKAAQVSYSEKITLSHEKLQEARCALIIRDGSGGDSQPRVLGLLALIKLENLGNSFVMSPLYVMANNAVAVTKEGDKKDAAAINLSIAVSTKGIGKQISGVPGLFPVGEGVFSMPNIPLGTNGSHVWCDKANKKACPKSDLVVYPDGNPVSVTFSVTETGNVGFDVDQNIAELKAVKAALGPAIKDALTEALK